MKYVVTVRNTVVTEEPVEVEADNVLSAMDLAEAYATRKFIDYSKWVAVSVIEIKEEEMSDLDNDFEKVAEQINAKIAEAAKILAEANKLAQDAGVEVIGASYYRMEDMSKKDLEKMRLIDFDPLLDELDNSGWRTSGLKC